MKPQRKTILVLEDEIPLQSAITSKLEHEGFKVVVGDCVADGLVYFTSGKIDGVWLDHYLRGEQNGLDFVKKLINNRLWKNTPIILVSNTVSPDKAQLYTSLGVKKCYTKVNHRLEDIVMEFKKCLENNV